MHYTLHMLQVCAYGIVTKELNWNFFLTGDRMVATG